MQDAANSPLTHQESSNRGQLGTNTHCSTRCIMINGRKQGLYLLPESQEVEALGCLTSDEASWKEMINAEVKPRKR
ncbi:hypothetical protein CDAR_252331 [Caerostris darwini]|uniref:Uncharacterized protein n=1 Tax=Caerostris darwini TaxID=1538125 RepID=A0AAV4Q833_9ARAC|nr:hypothetical protein CDAR_252331 [Caerostris darwini]